MSTGEMAYFAMALTAFAIFIGVVGFISVWSRRPGQRAVVSQPQVQQVDMWDAQRAPAAAKGGSARPAATTHRAA